MEHTIIVLGWNIISTTWAAIQQNWAQVPSPDKGGGLTGAYYTAVKSATNTMEMDKTTKVHTGSVIARVNKDRAVALGTRSFNGKSVTESQRTRLTMKFTVRVWDVR